MTAANRSTEKHGVLDDITHILRDSADRFEKQGLPATALMFRNELYRLTETEKQEAADVAHTL